MKKPKPMWPNLKKGMNFTPTSREVLPHVGGTYFNHRSYLNEIQLYLCYFEYIPNFISEKEINCSNAQNWFLKEFENDIRDFHYSKYFQGKSKQYIYGDCHFFIKKDLLVFFDTYHSRVRFLYKYTPAEEVEELLKTIRRFRKRNSRKPTINLLLASPAGMDLQEVNVTRPKLSVKDNYNDDFSEVHQTILQRLKKKRDKGLVLLHGKPGTGKTSYIRYLLTAVKKKVIFLPPNMAGNITNPDLLNILAENPDSIFVIEDAETIISSREKDGSSPVSALLNLSDGLLSDCLNIQIICSFNTDLSKVDPALLRKGRLIAKYEFKPLEVSKAQALSNKLGFEASIETAMTLTDIYNQKEVGIKEEKKGLGFMRTVG